MPMRPGLMLVATISFINLWPRSEYYTHSRFKCFKMPALISRLISRGFNPTTTTTLMVRTLTHNEGSRGFPPGDRADFAHWRAPEHRPLVLLNDEKSFILERAQQCSHGWG